MQSFRTASRSLLALSLALPLVLGQPGTARAMQFEVVGDTLIASGPVVDADLARLRDALAQAGLRQVLLHQSPGGDAWTGQRLGQEIRQARLDTLVSGRCASACGYIFLGGVQRRLTDGMPVRENRLMLHGAWDLETGRTRPDLAPGLATYIRRMTDGKYPEALVEATVNPAHPQDFIEFAITPRMLRSPEPRGVFQCLVGADQQRNCRELPGHSAVASGVVTHAEIVTLPPAVRGRLAALAGSQ